MQVLVKQADGRYGLQPASSADVVPSRGSSPSPVSRIAQRLQQMGKASGPKLEEDKTFLTSPHGDARHPGSWSKTPPMPGEAPSTQSKMPHPSILQGGKLSPRRAFVLTPAEEVVPEQWPRTETSESHDGGQLRRNLLALGSTFTGLDKQCEENAQMRREREEQRSQELLTVLANLEQAQHDEASNRELGFMGVRQAVERRLDAMVQHIQGKLSERFVQLSKSVETLSGRCSNVERGIAQLKGEVPSKLQLETAALKKSIQDMISELAEEIQRTSAKDDDVLARLQEGQRNVDNQLQKELAQLEKRGEALQELIDGIARIDSETQATRADIQNKFVDLNESIAQEVSQRETADDKVVQAINEYTSTLHRSLSVANA